MKLQLFCTALLAIFITGCSNDRQQAEKMLPQINLNTEFPEKEIWFQNVADVEYIPLETTEKILFKGSIVSLSKEGIVGVNRKEGDFFVFDGKGKVKCFINRKGGGPEEYASMVQPIVDWKLNELYVIDPKSRIYVYSLDGTFKRILETKNIIRERDICHYTDDQLMLFKEVPEGGNAEKIVPYRPVLLLSKTDGQLDSLSYLKRHNAFVTATFGEMKGWSFVPVLRNYDDKIYLNDVASDTVFFLNKKNNELKPFLTRVPSIQDEAGGKYLLIVEGITPRYVFLKRQIVQVDLEKQNEKNENRYWAYDRQTGEIFQPIFKNKDYSSMEMRNRNFEHCSGSKGDHFQLEAFRLKEALGKGELSGELKEIAEGISEEDNPILMIISFKEP